MVKVLTGVQTRCSVERIVFLPIPAEDGSKASAETGVLPALQRTTVDMRSKHERAVTRLAYPETIEIAD